MQDKEREYFLEKIEEIKENINDYSDEDLIEDTFEKIEVVRSTIIDRNRWSLVKENIYRYKNWYIRARWNAPATEMQEGQDTNLEIEEVKPVKKEIIDYISIESEEN